MKLLFVLSILCLASIASGQYSSPVVLLVHCADGQVVELSQRLLDKDANFTTILLQNATDPSQGFPRNTSTVYTQNVFLVVVGQVERGINDTELWIQENITARFTFVDQCLLLRALADYGFRNGIGLYNLLWQFISYKLGAAERYPYRPPIESTTALRIVTDALLPLMNDEEAWRLLSQTAREHNRDLGLEFARSGSWESLHRFTVLSKKYWEPRILNEWLNAFVKEDLVDAIEVVVTAQFMNYDPSNDFWNQFYWNGQGLLQTLTESGSARALRVFVDHLQRFKLKDAYQLLIQRLYSAAGARRLSGLAQLVLDYDLWAYCIARGYIEVLPILERHNQLAQRINVQMPMLTNYQQYAYQHWSADNPDIGSGDTMLTMAARRGYTRTVRWLLSRGANHSIASALDGKTALHWASAMGHTEVVRELLAKGADQGVVDFDGSPALGIVGSLYRRDISTGDYSDTIALVEQKALRSDVIASSVFARELETLLAAM